ncbi:hypothetical protein ABT024_04885 [Streptomyces sp. NPDC002812]|uniref:hypothetical protein n=1 Tax=Streptomyces sp. NPDC002812 TaxID=3154434 RepID=UPI003322E3ED
MPGSRIAVRLKRPINEVRADMQTVYAAVHARNPAHAVRQLRSHGMNYLLDPEHGAAA